jgi:hypothetical protein
LKGTVIHNPASRDGSVSLVVSCVRKLADVSTPGWPWLPTC